MEKNLEIAAKPFDVDNGIKVMDLSHTFGDEYAFLVLAGGIERSKKVKEDPSKYVQKMALLGGEFLKDDQLERLNASRCWMRYLRENEITDEEIQALAGAEIEQDKQKRSAVRIFSEIDMAQDPEAEMNLAMGKAKQYLADQ
jgi:hypothetical protein